MKAIRIHSFGGSDVLSLEDVPAPRPGDDEVLIKVQAASVNPVDYKMRSGKFRPDELHPPLTLGRDVAGIVAEVGRRVQGIRPGDRVYAMLGRHSGGYAEFALAKAEETAAKPATLDPAHAAAVPLAAITAWQGLFDHGRLGPGERVLILGAGGGVGLFAIQFARVRGAEVVATGRAEDLDLLRRLGASSAFEDETGDLKSRVNEVDLVLDLVGGKVQREALDLLKRGGRLISTLESPPPDEAARREIRAGRFMAEPRHDQLAEIGRLIDEGKVRVVLDQTLPLSEAKRAHDHMENEHVQGKVVLTVAE